MGDSSFSDSVDCCTVVEEAKETPGRMKQITAAIISRVTLEIAQGTLLKSNGCRHIHKQTHAHTHTHSLPRQTNQHPVVSDRGGPFQTHTRTHSWISAGCPALVHTVL